MVSESYTNLKGVTDTSLANPAPMRRPFLENDIKNVRYENKPYIAVDGRSAAYDPNVTEYTQIDGT